MRDVTCAVLDDGDFRPGIDLDASRQGDLNPEAFDRTLGIQVLVHRGRVIKNRVGQTTPVGAAV